MGTIFDFLDSKNDLTVARGELTTYLKQDERIVKLLHVDAVRISHFQTLSLEQMIDFIACDGESEELITWKQFVDYFYTKPTFAISKETVGEGVVEFSDDPRLDEIILSDEYILILKQKYDSLPRITNQEVSTFKYIKLLNEDPDARGLLGFTVRQPPKGLSEIPHEETLSSVLTRIEADGATLLSWEDMTGYLSVRGKPKSRQTLTHSKFVELKSDASPEKKPPGVDFFTQTDSGEAAEKDRTRPITAIPANEERLPPRKPSTETSGKSYKITVPKPFSFEMREKIKKTGIRQSWIANMVAEKVAEEQKECATRPKPKEIPIDVKNPRYDGIVAENEARRDEVKRTSMEKTKANEKPFNFYIRDLAKKKVEEIVKPKIKPFKANPIPWEVTAPIFKEMITSQAEKRAESVKNRALQSLALASLPPRMQQHAEAMKQKLFENKSSDDLWAPFRAKPAPKFKDLDLEEQRKKWPKKVTNVVPFNFIGDALKQTKEEERRKAQSLEPVPEKVNRKEKWAKAKEHVQKVLSSKNPWQVGTTKKWEDQVKLRKVVEEKKKAEEDAKLQEEVKRQQKINAAKGRVQSSEDIVDNVKKLQAEKAATLKRKTAERKQMDKDYAKRLEEIQNRTKQRPLLFEKPQGVLSTELARIKGIIHSRTVMSAFSPEALLGAKKEAEPSASNENAPPALVPEAQPSVDKPEVKPTEVPAPSQKQPSASEPLKEQEKKIAMATENEPVGLPQVAHETPTAPAKPDPAKSGIDSVAASQPEVPPASSAPIVVPATASDAAKPGPVSDTPKAAADSLSAQKPEVSEAGVDEISEDLDDF